MGRRLSILLLLVISLAGCTSARNERPASIPQPELSAYLVTDVFFGSGTSAPAPIQVDIRNRATVPIVVRRIQIESPGMAQYTIGRADRYFRETVSPGETKSLTVFATAYAQTTRRPSEPLQLRVFIEFESGEARWREILMTRG